MSGALRGEKVMREISVTEIAAKYEETIADRLRRHGLYDGVIAMFEAKDAEIERLREALRIIGESCPSHIIKSKDAEVNALLAYNAGLTARAALGDKELCLRQLT